MFLYVLSVRKRKGKNYTAREDLLNLSLIFSSSETIASSHSDITVSRLGPLLVNARLLTASLF